MQQNTELTCLNDIEISTAHDRLMRQNRHDNLAIINIERADLGLLSENLQSFPSCQVCGIRVLHLIAHLYYGKDNTLTKHIYKSTRSTYFHLRCLRISRRSVPTHLPPLRAHIQSKFLTLIFKAQRGFAPNI